MRWTPSRIGLESAINAEKATSKAETNPDLLQDETRLHKRLEKLRLNMHVVRGDGNCQVRLHHTHYACMHAWSRFWCRLSLGLRPVVPKHRTCLHGVPPAHCDRMDKRFAY